MGNEILARILQIVGNPDLIDSFTNLSGTDMTSLMLEIYRRRVSRRSPKMIWQQYLGDRFSRPANVTQEEMTTFDSLAFRMLPKGYRTVELSPLCPIGTCSVLAPVDQNNIVSTVRNTEVLSDATNVLALEAARIRHESESIDDVIRLCTSHRQVRAQLYEGPASFAHFRLLALVTAGRKSSNYETEFSVLNEQIKYYLKLFNELNKKGYEIEKIRVELLPSQAMMKRVERSVLPMIRSLNLSHETSIAEILDSRYYEILRFRIFAITPDEQELNIGDGGFTVWTQTLLNNKKEFLLTGGIGTERILGSFRRK